MHFDTLAQRDLGIMKLPRKGKLSFYSEANKTFIKKIYVAWQKTGHSRRRRRKLAVKRHFDLLINLARWIQQL